jgi:hypothetical protein
MKNSLSKEAMMLATSVLIGGMLGGCVSAGDGGGPSYITVSSSTASGLKSVIPSSSSIHGNGTN